MRYRTPCGGGGKIPEHGEKVKLRLWTYGFWRQGTVLDLFAGMGCLSEEYAKAGCERLICVEKEEEYYDVLREMMKPYRNVELYLEDNMDFLDGEVVAVTSITYVDFDAFGCPNQQIVKFFEKYPIRQTIMVNVTDGTLLNLNRLATIDLGEYYLINLFQRGYLSRRDFDSKRNLRRLLPWLQREFIHILAAKHSFSTSFVYHAMNREANVMYYAFIAYPEAETSLWATGMMPMIRFRKDESSQIKTLRKVKLRK